MHKLFALIILAVGLHHVACLTLEYPTGFTTSLILSFTQPNVYRCFQKSVKPLGEAVTEFRNRAKNCTGDINDKVTKYLIRFVQAIEKTKTPCTYEQTRCAAIMLTNALTIIDMGIELIEAALNGKFNFKIPLIMCTYKEIRSLFPPYSNLIQELIGCITISDTLF